MLLLFKLLTETQSLRQGSRKVPKRKAPLRFSPILELKWHSGGPCEESATYLSSVNVSFFSRAAAISLAPASPISLYSKLLTETQSLRQGSKRVPERFQNARPPCVFLQFENKNGMVRPFPINSLNLCRSIPHLRQSIPNRRLAAGHFSSSLQLLRRKQIPQSSCSVWFCTPTLRPSFFGLFAQ